MSKNGYEIRAEILSLASGLLTEEYHSRYAMWEATTAPGENGIRDAATAPKFPQLDQVLLVAERMYAFVNKKEK